MNKLSIKKFVALCFLLFGGFFGGFSAAAANDTITFTWQVNSTTLYKGITIQATNAQQFTVYWGDGTSQTYTGKGSTSLSPSRPYYADTGTYTVTVIGNTAACMFTYLDCYGSSLTNLDVSKSTALTDLYCNSNSLTSLDVSKNTALTTLYCNDNSLTNVDVSKNTALTTLYCNDNSLTNLDVSKNTALTILYCNNNFLTNLNVSGCTALTFLNCNNNSLTSLDVSKNTALTKLYCNINSLTNLDVSKNTALTYLDCSQNSLTNVDVSKNTALRTLYCNNNSLTNLDVSKNTALTELYCYLNSLTSLNVSGTALTNLYCDLNRLSLSDLYAASLRVGNVNNRYLGKQILPTTTILPNGSIDFSSQAKFGTPDTLTVFAVNKGSNPADTITDYSTTNGKITFYKESTYTVTMTNAAIKSSSSFPAVVIDTVNVVFIPVNTITGVPATATINVPLMLTGTVEPSNASFKNITWSVAEQGKTSAVITGNQFFALQEGQAIITATIQNGTAIGTDYKQSFFITVGTVGIKELTMNNGQLTIYPNPTSGQLRISGDIWDSKDREIRIFNVVGQVVFTSQLSKLSPEITIDISHLANGLYFLKIDGKMFKIMKE